jgi:hypothetical protein
MPCASACQLPRRHLPPLPHFCHLVAKSSSSPSIPHIRAYKHALLTHPDPGVPPPSSSQSQEGRPGGPGVGGRVVYPTKVPKLSSSSSSSTYYYYYYYYYTKPSQCWPTCKPSASRVKAHMLIRCIAIDQAFHTRCMGGMSRPKPNLLSSLQRKTEGLNHFVLIGSEPAIITEYKFEQQWALWEIQHSHMRLVHER